MKFHRHFHLTSFALFFFASAQANAEECLVGELRSNLGASQTLQKTPASQFASWNLDHLPTLQADNFFPSEFLDKIKKELGPVRVKITDHTKEAGKFRGYESASFEIATSQRTLARWTVIFDRKH
ncbi:MAG: hypothetical protein ACJ763_09770, partial [Bdellovibrionia bacterium]